MQDSKLQVRPFHPTDLHRYWDHLRRHGSESGRNGDLVFMPFEEAWGQSIEELRKTRDERHQKSIHEPGWERCWVLTDETEIYGDLRLSHEPPIKSCLHRATLSMGIEREFRGQGHGSQMVEVAVGWARQQPSLKWLQLYVFENNAPAIGLYQKFGFRESGRIRDMFRLFGKEITDMTMVLEL